MGAINLNQTHNPVAIARHQTMSTDRAWDSEKRPDGKGRWSTFFVFPPPQLLHCLLPTPAVSLQSIPGPTPSHPPPSAAVHMTTAHFPLHILSLTYKHKPTAAKGNCSRSPGLWPSLPLLSFLSLSSSLIPPPSLPLQDSKAFKPLQGEAKDKRLPVGSGLACVLSHGAQEIGSFQACHDLFSLPSLWITPAQAV